MSRPPKSEEWLVPAAELMVRESISLRQAVSHLGLEVTSDQCEAVERRKSWKKIVWDARHKYWDSLGGDPALNKNSVIGQLLLLAQQLREEGELDKSAEVLFKLSKLAGWVGPEQVVNAFGGLNAKEFEELRARVKQQTEQPEVPNPLVQ